MLKDLLFKKIAPVTAADAEPIQRTEPCPANYEHYAQEFEQTLCSLMTSIQKNTDPKETALAALRTAYNFYGADWAGIMLADFDVDIWSLLWWHHPVPNDKTKTMIGDIESSDYLHCWGNAMKEKCPIIIPDTSAIREESPKEYSLYSHLGAKSILAVPFEPRPIGFLVLRNPTRYIQNSSMLKMLAYVVLTALVELKMEESAKRITLPSDIKNNNEFVIHTFGTLEIHSAKGVLTQDELRSPRMCRLLIYLLLHPKTAHPPREIADAIWPEEELDQDAVCSNLRGLIYRFRQAFSLISDQDLIISTSAGYKLNPDLKIMTDMDNFDNAWQAVQSASGTVQRVNLIKDALALYTGEMYPPAAGEMWMLSTANHYSLRYQGLARELIIKLADAQEWNSVCHYATQVLKLIPDHFDAVFWLIWGMYNSGAMEIAKSELQYAKDRFDPEEYQELVERLKKYKAEK